ncbi:STAS domain-containing protein [Luteipulveratus sp. YIM 133132]|uniref:STAS domain-containing protein n=1 Tax=Luteipulveratus flavus TaxID=3031728 RepID=UPI0023B03C61|nr:STAS domain-containing protein [Luteipulveratus sp. YIM 133132]MDE9367799.1 STAS domain-containing protein [Luteipulveratus sp. YIM 133132]
MDLSISRKDVLDGTTVVSARGEVDMYTAPMLRDALNEAIDSGARRLVLDLGGVPFMDSVGLGVLVGRHKQLETVGGGLQLVAVSEPLMRVMRITGLKTVFVFHSTVDEALARLTAPQLDGAVSGAAG